MPIHTERRRVYHVSPMRYYMPWFIFGPMILLFLLLVFDPKNSAAGILLALIFFICALGTQWLIGRARLEVSEAGIRLIQVGYTLETSWANITHLRMDRGREGFITREPMQGKGVKRLASVSSFGLDGASLYDSQQRSLLEGHRLIPIEAFVWHIKHGALGADLERFAPHLKQNR